MTRHLPALLLTLATVSVPAFADSGSLMSSGRASERSVLKTEQEIGVFIAGGPRYPGAREIKGMLSPYVEANFRNGMFVSSTDGIGFRFLDNADGFSAAMSLDGSGQRREKHGAHDGINRLRGMGDIDSRLRANLLLNYDNGPLHGSAKLSRTLGSRHDTALDLTVGYDLHNDRDNLVRASAGLTWGNRDLMQTWFGVDAAQSARSGNRIYTADSGVAGGAVGVTWRHAFNRDWVGTVGAGVSTLRGSAADSPLTERKTSAMIGGAIGYRF